MRVARGERKKWASCEPLVSRTLLHPPEPCRRRGRPVQCSQSANNQSGRIILCELGDAADVLPVAGSSSVHDGPMSCTSDDSPHTPGAAVR